MYHLPIDPMLLIVGFSVLSVVLLIAVIVCIVKMNKLYRRYDLFMRGKDAETLEDTLEDILEELKESQSRDRASKDAMKRLSKQVKDSFQKFGFVKYNAFKGRAGISALSSPCWTEITPALSWMWYTAGRAAISI